MASTADTATADEWLMSATKHSGDRLLSFSGNVWSGRFEREESGLE